MKPEFVNFIHKPEILISSNGNVPLDARSRACLESSPLTATKVKEIKDEISGHFVSVATDLASYNLAKGHTTRLIDHLIEKGAKTEYELLAGGAQEFYRVAKEILGPLWASYVDTVLSSGKGGENYLFAARDATPMFFIAKGLVENYASNYKVDGSKLIHIDWNRWFMGQEDETEDHQKPLSLSDETLRKFYDQMEFGTGKMIKIVEPGAWGSAANALKTIMPDQPFELWFMFSHMPDRIYGFLNQNACGVDEKHFEMINDTAESVPKAYVRPTTLIVNDGKIVGDIEGKVINSHYMNVWSKAVNKGAYHAGLEFANGVKTSVAEQITKIISLSDKAKTGQWTGVLPMNTPTWSDGENWVKNWPWGKIPPLK